MRLNVTHEVKIDLPTRIFIRDLCRSFCVTDKESDFSEIKEMIQIVMSNQEQFNSDVAAITSSIEESNAAIAALKDTIAAEHEQVAAAIAALAEQITILQGRAIDTGALVQVKELLSATRDSLAEVNTATAAIFEPPAEPPVEPEAPVEPPVEPDTPAEG